MSKDVKRSLPKETRVSDLQLGAYLLAKEYLIIRIEGASPRTEFIFADVPEEVVLSFYQENSTVNPRKILDALRNLKGLLIQQDRGRR